MKVVGNLKGLIEQATVEYISINEESFKSTTPGPQGPTGGTGPQGVSVHHLKGTSTTQDEGDFAYPGETDTYTFYPDANETYPLGWFNVRNGQDAYNYAVMAGYAGSEVDFYLELAAVREYYEQSQINADTSSANAAQVAIDAAQVSIDAAQVAADRVVVDDAVLQAGQEMIVNVTNGTGSTISNGKVVMMVSAPGNSGQLVAAPYDGTSPGYMIVGITTESIVAGGEGRVTSYGRVRGLDTSAWDKDTILYVDGSNLTSTAPSSGLNMRLATVLRQHATNGTLMVRLNGYTQVEEW